MKFKFKIFIIIFTLLSTSICVANVNDNFYIIDSLIAESVKLLSKNKDLDDTLFLSYNKHSATWLVSQNYIKTLTEQNHVISNDSNHSNLQILIKDINIEYSIIAEDEKKVLRKITPKIDYIYKSNNIIKPLQNSYLSYSDTIEIDRIPNLELSSHDFVKGDLVAGETSFFEKYLEPVIFTTAAILTVVLLFSVRSN